MARQWGFWTKGKLDILRDYLDAFTTASKGSREILYFDLFAGEPENVDRVSGRPIEGSARIALSIDDRPFSRLRFFEMSRAPELEGGLRADFPNRDLRVYSGDCNETVAQALADLEHLSWAPSFAFVDPDGPDYKWATLEALATFKAGQKTKVELWMLFPEPMFVRFLRTDGGEVEQHLAERISDMYGTDEWRAIYEARLAGDVPPAEARAEYVNLMRWRLETLLAYRWTHALEVYNEQGRPIYHLIFATDHSAGNRIMSHLYGRALAQFPTMRQHAIDQRKGTLRLFDASEFAEIPEAYRYEPPRRPYGTDQGD